MDSRFRRAGLAINKNLNLGLQKISSFLLGLDLPQSFRQQEGGGHTNRGWDLPSPDKKQLGAWLRVFNPVCRLHRRIRDH